ncbi:MAG: nucleotidyl transferase AbiEii/AbiGii toxin family protein [Sedimentisphaerales bacterium]|nr:nucleotidyl transferase AbiEii/AbiGii toxin family protein [Sedimentisphaerales bacterium]
MKEFLRQILNGVENPVLGRCLVREYLQARLLQSFQDKGVFNTWLFQGGTALRFLYSMPRFSEDLDFALVKTGMEDNFRDILLNARKTFEAEDYDISIKVNDTKTVKSAFVKFGSLLFELGLSAHRSETLSVKVEIDTNPPAGARCESTIVRRHVTLNLRHHDKASLLAGKLHAVLARRYVKGRDIYDLIWYLSDRSWPQPNIELLNNALVQTDWKGPEVTQDNWRTLLREKIDKLKWARVVEDVQPFLERPEDVKLLTQENLMGLLQE